MGNRLIDRIGAERGSRGRWDGTQWRSMGWDGRGANNYGALATLETALGIAELGKAGAGGGCSGRRLPAPAGASRGLEKLTGPLLVADPRP